MTTAKPDISTSDIASTAQADTHQSSIMMGKATPWKAKVAKANNRWKVILHDKTPNNQYGGWCKKANQLITKNHYNVRILANIV
jgi:hypothetical protein